MLQQNTYQAKQWGPHYFEPKGPNAPKWYIVDAQDQVVGRLATIITRVIIGKHKPTFTKHADTGDFVIVINCDKVVFTRGKWEGKLYRSHSGYVSGLKTVTAKDMLKRHPTEIMRQAVWGMMNKSSLGRHQIKKLKLFAGPTHPHQAQEPQPLPAGTIRHTVLSRPKKQA